MRNDSGRKQSARRGAAFLLLVIAVLLVITGATFQMLQSEWTIRRARGEAQRAETMQRAIDAVANADAASDQAVRMPVDENQWIEVATQSNDDGEQLVANWVRNGNVIDTLKRRMNDD